MTAPPTGPGLTPPPPPPWTRSSILQVVDNAFGAELAHQMRDEVAGLAHEARMHRNATHLVKGGETEFLCELTNSIRNTLPHRDGGPARGSR